MRRVSAAPWLVLIGLCWTCLGCAKEPSVDVTRWQLAVDGEPPRAVVLPAKLPVGDGQVHYVLSAEVPLPPEIRGHASSLTFVDTLAAGELRIDGKPALSCLGPRILGPHGTGPLCWHFVAPDEPSTRFELDVHQVQSIQALFGSPATIAPVPDGTARFRLVALFNAWTETATVAVTALFGTLYLSLYLLDRLRRAHLAFAVQTFGFGVWGLWRMGVTQVVARPVEDLLTVVAVASSLFAALVFTHLQLGLGRVGRVWKVLYGISLGSAVAVWAGFPSASAAVALIDIVFTVFQLVVCTRALLDGSRDRVTPLTIGSTWMFLVVAQPIDLAPLLRLPGFAGGVHISTIAMCTICIGQGLLLARQHALSLRDADRLNAELRRQVAERSRQLADALARLDEGDPRSSSRSVRVGQTVADRYRVERLLGTGGMGAVYEVVRLSDDRHLALKLVNSHSSRDDLARLAREAHIAAKITHPNLVSIVDIDVSTSHGCFLVMDLVEGGSLDAHRARYGEVPWALSVLSQVSEGLAALHAAGVVHRDLKPGNVLLDGDHAKISDFGIASIDDAHRGIGRGESVSPEARTAAAGQPLTRTGVMLGTLVYMAPELAAGSARASPAVDLFALGVLAFEILGAGYPFPAPPLLDAIYGRPAERVRGLDGVAGLPRDAARAIEACLDPDPARRPTARHVAERLRAATP